VLLYIGTIGYLGIDLKNALIFSFFFLFFTSNLTDDFYCVLMELLSAVFGFLFLGVFGCSKKVTFVYFLKRCKVFVRIKQMVASC